MLGCVKQWRLQESICDSVPSFGFSVSRQVANIVKYMFNSNMYFFTASLFYRYYGKIIFSTLSLGDCLHNNLFGNSSVIGFKLAYFSEHN